MSINKVLYTFTPSKSFGELLDISPKYLYLKKILYIEVQFTDQNSKLRDIEDEINITLVVN